MLCGLTAPTSGTATVLGRPFRDLPNPGRQVGVLLDASAQHAGRSGRETLLLSARVMGLPPTRVPEVLDLVGLSSREARARTRTYSLGMRQRLGLAHALLGAPEVLVLDEPVNGLDPGGMRWIRSLLRQFADDGGTVLLSSHLLREVEAVADDIVILGGGHVVAAGRTDELVAAQGTHARSTDDEALARALTGAGHRVTACDGPGLTTTATVEQVGAAALRSGVVLTDLRRSPASGLEQLFMTATASHAREGVAA